jgi:chromosomal replication initiation ATPase DnaA
MVHRANCVEPGEILEVEMSIKTISKPDYLERRKQTVKLLRQIADDIEAGCDVKEVTVENIMQQIDNGFMITYADSGLRKLLLTWRKQ